LRAKTNKTLEK